MKKLLLTLLAASWLLAGCERPAANGPEKPPRNTVDAAADFTPRHKLSLNFGPYEHGQSPHQGQTLSPEQLNRRLDILRPFASWVRTYGLGGGLDTIPALAHRMGLRVAAGAWLSRDLEANEHEIARLIALGQAGEAELLIVGSETLFRHDLTAAQLLDYLRRVKTAVPNTPITTADVADALLDNPDIIAACDLVFANIYPYWEGQDIECALAAFDKKYRALKTAAGGKEIRISESGWPSAGNSISEAQASLENAAVYLRQLLSWAEANAVQVFVFEAFDEVWKAEEEGPQGAHWGLFDEAGHLKPALRPVLETAPEAPGWKDCAPARPGLAMTLIPRYGDRQGVLAGQATGVDFEAHRIVVLIRVQGVWWVKPYANDRSVFIAPDGSWEADIVTGGQDDQATEIAAFLVPAAYDPPSVLGLNAIPKALKNKAVAKTSVRRDLR